MKRMVWVILVIFLLGACAPSPLDLADADVIRWKGEQEAADQAQARAQRETQFQTEQQMRDQQSAQWVASWNQFVKNTMFVLNICVGFSMIGTSVGLIIAVISTGQAWAIYAKARAKTAADLIYPDPQTRLFPLLKYEHKGKYTLANPGNDSVRLLDSAHEPDRQLIAAMSAIQLAGTVAYEARKSKQPAAIVEVEPVVIGYKDKSGIEIGASFLRQAREILTGGRR
jgi:hypothetical protein